MADAFLRSVTQGSTKNFDDREITNIFVRCKDFGRRNKTATSQAGKLHQINNHLDSLYLKIYVMYHS